MPWRSVKDIYDNSNSRNPRTFETIYNEATAGGMQLAVIRWKRAVPGGSSFNLNGMLGFKSARDEEPNGDIVRYSWVDPQHYVAVMANESNEGFALVPVSSRSRETGEIVTCKRNLDILVDIAASGNCPWEIMTPEVAQRVEALVKAKQSAPVEVVSKQSRKRKEDFEGSVEAAEKAAIKAGKVAPRTPSPINEALVQANLDAMEKRPRDDIAMLVK
jgi:hypothetical protein